MRRLMERKQQRSQGQPQPPSQSEPDPEVWAAPIGACRTCQRSATRVIYVVGAARDFVWACDEHMESVLAEVEREVESPPSPAAS